MDSEKFRGTPKGVPLFFLPYNFLAKGVLNTINRLQII